MLWQAFQTLVPVDSPGSGPLAYSIVFGRQRRGWTIPAGGSGRLTDALVRSITDDGGEVLCDRPVAGCWSRAGAAPGSRPRPGRRFRAREAVISTIHVKHLVEMAPAEAWGEDFRYGVETYDVGLSGSAVYMATSRPPSFETRGGRARRSPPGSPGWPSSWSTTGGGCATASMMPILPGCWSRRRPSPTRRGRREGHHTVKLLSGQGWRLPRGRARAGRRSSALRGRQLERVRAFAPGFSEEAILASLVKGPYEIEARTATWSAAPSTAATAASRRAGALRPVPGCGQYRMPIEGLYQTGGTTHPGGSITGAPGRNAAIVVLADRGRVSASGCRRAGSRGWRADRRRRRPRPRDRSGVLRNGHPGELWRPRVRRERGGQVVEFGGREIRSMVNEAVDVETLLAVQARAGIGAVVICPWVPLLYPDAEPRACLERCRVQNEALAGSRRHPDRVAALGAVPLQDPELAAAELLSLRREGKLAGVEVAASVGGVYLGDRASSRSGRRRRRPARSSSSTRRPAASPIRRSPSTTSGTRSATRSRPRSRRRR